MIKFIFRIVGFVIGLLYLSILLSVYISPNFLSFASSYAMLFPLALILMLLLIISGFFFNWKTSILLILITLIGYKNIKNFIALNFENRHFKVEKKPQSIRILQWNVGTFADFRETKKISAEKERIGILEYLNPDIICLEEVFISDKSNIIKKISKTLNYPYLFIPNNNFASNSVYYGTVILSRYPILSKRIYPYSIGSIFDNILNADIETPKGNFSIFTTHLQSNQFTEEELEMINNLTTAPEQLMNEEKHKLLKKINKHSNTRSYQIQELQQHILLSSAYPYLLCIDMNEIPTSYNYFSFDKTAFKDAFLESGFGIGRTYRFVAPFLRLDYIFTAPNIKVHQFAIFYTTLSDHYPILADIELIE
ncbi:MAG: endonuclease/exonuclease/phosphatase family protein [Chitinophagaceae bacterium]